MLGNLLAGLWRENKCAKTPRPGSSCVPSLEELESRLTPTTFISTATNATVQIIPNFFNMTATEKVTATIVPALGGAPITGNFPLPIYFNLNNQVQSTLFGANGQTTTTFTLPLLTLLTSQELTVSFPGILFNNNGDFINYSSSTFNAPLYMNFDNLLFPSMLSFNLLSAQQIFGNTGAPIYNTGQSEMDTLGLFSFRYVDPGVIAQVLIFGQQFPGFFAAALGAYGPAFMNNGAGG